MHPWKTKKLRQLAQAFLSLKTEEEVQSFLRDLATLEELREFAARWDAVLELNNDQSYREIARKTKLSTATITRIAHWLYHGEGGYRTALQRRAK